MAAVIGAPQATDTPRTTTRDGRSELTIRRDPATGREIHQMTRSDQASFHSYYDLCPWNARGDKIVFCATTEGAPGSDVYWMDAADGTIHFIAHTSRTNPHTGVHQQWIGNGDVVAFEDADANGPYVQLVELDTGGSALRPRPGRRPIAMLSPAAGRTGRLPGLARMVSPDGNLVASHTNSRDEDAIMRRDRAGVFVARMPALGQQGDAPRLIASTEAALRLNPHRDEIGHCHIYTKHAKFSPDSRRLMFVFTNEIEYDVRYGEPRVKDIYVVNADGSNLRFVSHFTWGNHPSWHPNGRQILFNGRLGSDGSTARTDPMRFVLADIETGSLSIATDLIPGGGHPPYSPDGTKIAAEYVSRDSGEARVVCVDLAHQQVRDLAHFRVTDHSHQGTHIHPTWSRDGQHLLFNVDESGHSEIWVASVETE